MAITSGPLIDIQKALELQGQMLTYEGDMDEASQPSGNGKATFRNGSIYEGKWSQSLRHGVGKDVKSNGDIYVGTFEFGIRHGKGQLTQSDGSVYTGTWLKGKLDGITVCKNSDNEPSLVIFKHGIQVQQASKNVSLAVNFVTVIQVIFMAWLYIGMPLFMSNNIHIWRVCIYEFTKEDYATWGCDARLSESIIWPAICSVLVICICFCIIRSYDDTEQFLENVKQLPSAAEEISRGVKAAPGIHLYMEAYHMSKQGGGRYSSYKRSITNRADYSFKYTEFVDNSEPVSSLYFLKALPLLRLNQKKEIKMSAEVQERYEAEKKAFIDENNTDSQYELHEYKYIDGFTDKSIVHTSKDGDNLPWYISSNFLCFGDFSQVGWIQRWMLAVKTYVVEYRFRKTVLK